MLEEGPPTEAAAFPGRGKSREPQGPKYRQSVMSRMWMIALLLVLLPACVPTDVVPETPDRRAGRGRELYEATAMILENAEHRPMLCLGMILESLPPQCGDVRIANWDWDRVKGEERLASTIWGRYHVEGTFDGKSFTATDVDPPQKEDPIFDSDPIGTPCSEPEGGWEVPDPNRAGQADVNASNAAVRHDPAFAGLWIEDLDAAGEDATEDQGEILLNVAFTANLERHEQGLREHWSGPLCVTKHDWSLRRLQRIQSEELRLVTRRLGIQQLFTDIDVEDNVVEVGVVVIDHKDREAIEERFGKGAVRILAALQPAT